MTEPGTLYITGTPIGNLEDMTYRAVRILRSVELVAAEDTRRTRALLTHFGIHTRLVSYYEHNRRDAGEKLLATLGEGFSVALVTDAGMPCISDPGWELVRDARACGIPVTVVPGPSAAAAAVALSGMDGGSWVFEGFLPAHKKQRAARLARMAREPRMMVVYEAPHRLEDTLNDLEQALGDRRAVLCNDLTKFYEKVSPGPLSALRSTLSTEPPRGEYVLVLEAVEPPPEPPPWQGLTEAQHVETLMIRGLTKKQAIKEAARQRGVPKTQVYEGVLQSRTPAEEDEGGV